MLYTILGSKMKLYLFIILFFLSPICFSGQTSVDSNLLSKTDFYQQRLDKALKEYQSLQYRKLKEKHKIKVLIDLDKNISDIVVDIHVNRESIKEPFWREDYKKIGVYIGHYGSIAYYNKLLAKAHKLNSKSYFRNYTLYSKVFSQYTSRSWNAMPNVKAAEHYLNEFPNGPYAWKVNEALGYFYYDLFKVFRDVILNKKTNQKSDRIPADCYNSFILDKPYSAQFKATGIKSTWHFRKALVLFPKIKTVGNIKEALEQIKHPKLWGGVWYYCVD